MVLLAAAGNVFPATLYVDVNSTNLTASPAFVTLATGIEGQAGATTFVDSNARGAGPFFYRVGVSTP
jgi:hypothetical protein